MNEAIWLIIGGLVFDIIGAYFILRPLIHLYKRYWGDEKPDLESKARRFIGPPDAELVRVQKRDQREARIGFILLGFGFFLQMVGNWIQNPPL